MYSDSERGTANILSPPIVQEEEDYDLIYYDDVVPISNTPGAIPTDDKSGKNDQPLSPGNLTKVGREESRGKRDVSDDAPLTNNPEFSDEVKRYHQKRSGDVCLKPI